MTIHEVVLILCAAAIILLTITMWRMNNDLTELADEIDALKGEGDDGN